MKKVILFQLTCDNCKKKIVTKKKHGRVQCGKCGHRTNIGGGKSEENK